MIKMSFYDGTSIIDDSGNYLDITETDNEILLNTFSSNDMW